MKREVGIFFGIAILIALASYVVYDSYKMFGNAPGMEERKITQEEFSKLLLSQEQVAVVMHLESGEDKGAKNKAVIECAVGLAGSISRMGKAVSNYAFEDNYCLDPELEKLSQEECMGDMGGRYYFEVRYGEGSTVFYNTRTVVHVNEEFVKDCAIRMRTS